MRIVIESKRVLVVESPGRVVPALAGLLIIAHIGFLAKMLAPGYSQTTLIVLGVVSAFAYGVALYLAFKPLRDRFTTTFHGTQHEILVEHEFPLGLKRTHRHSYDDFTGIEVSPPSDKGLCRLRLKSGGTVMLFRFDSIDEFAALDHLEMITHKKVETLG
jgi:hypothetical protein